MRKGLRRFLLLLVVAIVSVATINAQGHSAHSHTGHSKKLNLAPSEAWSLIPPLGLREKSTIDTLLYNYWQLSVPSEVSTAWASTGNLGGEGIDMIFSGRPAMSDFFFRDAIDQWIPTFDKMKFYNTRQPMTLLSFNTSGGRENAQERLKAIFSGNINAKAQVGANLDYLYSKGSYANQAVKDLSWGANGSYLGDRYEFQGYYNHYNLLNKENGGITDALYITDPAALQGGVDKIEAKSIPTNLNSAHSRVRGEDLWLNNRYKVGYWVEKRDSIDTDSVISRSYVPVTSFIHTLRFRAAKHMFLDTNTKETSEFFENNYLNPNETRDWTTYWSLSNTIGVSMLEGFHRLAKFGLAAYATYELRRYTQVADTLDRSLYPELTPLPEGVESIPNKASQSLLWIGGQLTKQRGSILTYEADVRFGLAGVAAGDLRLSGRLDTRLHLPAVDTLSIGAFGEFNNEHAPYLMNNFVSNHFAWRNDFGKERRVSFGGELDIPRSLTHARVGVTNLQNYIYFGPDFTPRQNSGSIQVFSATLRQGLKAGILHWDNTITYQATSDADIMPLPALAVNTNLYILFRFHTLNVQLGVDCDYYTRYRGLRYQPATMSFSVQSPGEDAVKVGNYPFCNFYVNMKLKKARFYVLLSHFNQGLFGGSDFFAMPLYPMNPRRLQLGISVDFAN
ncbi:MAG: putative porin [Muribaculaceae bacterium]|nr:putative porin [Muribaculaceae bacterium]